MLSGAAFFFFEMRSSDSETCDFLGFGIVAPSSVKKSVFSVVKQQLLGDEIRGSEVATLVLPVGL